MKKTFIVLAAVMFVVGLMFAGNAAAGVIGTGHDFSAAGPGDLGSATAQVCVFCHHPHRGTDVVDDLLWNFGGIQTRFATYNSTTNATIDGTTEDVDAATAPRSYLCLACHDGIIAANALIAVPGDTGDNTDGLGGEPTGSANLGTTLEDDHPVNITLSGDANMATIGAVTAAGGLPIYNLRVQCATCHDVHDTAITSGTGVAFMRTNDWMTNSKICTTCHLNKG